jgi:hypothetical protein
MHQAYRLVTAFPAQQLDDNSATIQAAGLANSVIIQKAWARAMYKAGVRAAGCGPGILQLMLAAAASGISEVCLPLRLYLLFQGVSWTLWPDLPGVWPFGPQ